MQKGRCLLVSDAQPVSDKRILSGYCLHATPCHACDHPCIHSLDWLTTAQDTKGAARPLR